MRPTTRLICFTATMLVAAQAASVAAWADPTPQQIKCEWKKHRKVGRYQACVQNAVVEKVKNPLFDLDAAKAACAASFETAWLLQDDLAAGVMQECLDGPGNFDEVRAMLDGPADRLEAWLAGTRFVDNGNGTVTDNKTGLVWEKKTTAVGSGANLADPHDVDNTYSWGSIAAPYPPNGTAFTDFIARLNGSADGACFAGHCDWRLPTVEELASILDLAAPGCGGGSPCISGVFGPTVPSSSYWSSTFAGSPLFAWYVRFSDGITGASGRNGNFYVRAVRGGS